jgi:hypothetical protein
MLKFALRRLRGAIRANCTFREPLKLPVIKTSNRLASLGNALRAKSARCARKQFSLSGQIKLPLSESLASLGNALRAKSARCARK